ncbi:hypothetical protein ABZ907_31950 [Nonomuraea wenchangensis]
MAAWPRLVLPGLSVALLVLVLPGPLVALLVLVPGLVPVRWRRLWPGPWSTQ